jgi:hypothetical protein
LHCFSVAALEVEVDWMLFRDEPWRYEHKRTHWGSGFEFESGGGEGVEAAPE